MAASEYVFLFLQGSPGTQGSQGSPGPPGNAGPSGITLIGVSAGFAQVEQSRTPLEVSRKPFFVALLIQNPTCHEELLEKLMNLLHSKVGHKFFFSGN